MIQPSHLALANQVQNVQIQLFLAYMQACQLSLSCAALARQSILLAM